VYFGYADTATWERVLNFSYGAISFIVALSIMLATKETKVRAFDNAFTIDSELVESNKKTEENAKIIKKKDKRMKRSVKWISEFNKQQQEMYNEILTNKEISKLERKITALRIDGNENKAKRLERRINRLNKQPLFDKSFEPYDIKKLVNIDTSGLDKIKKKGNVEISHDPKKVSFLRGAFSSLLRATGLSLTAIIPFAWSQSFKSIVIFYLGYLIMISFTIVSQYIITTHKTLNRYKKGLFKTETLQELLIEHLEKGESNVPMIVKEVSNET
jgi:hypothetical protein